MAEHDGANDAKNNDDSTDSARDEKENGRKSNQNVDTNDAKNDSGNNTTKSRDERPAGSSDNDADDLGDKGKKAIDREREARKSAEKTLRELQSKVREYEDKDKSELQRLQDRAERAEKELADRGSSLERLEVAIEKAPDGMPLSKVRSLAKRLAGSSRDELEADAEELFAEFKPEDKRQSAKDVLPSRPNDGQKQAGDDKPDPKRIAREALNRHR